MTYPARHLSVSIERPPAEVYAYASNPRHLPAWASGLSGSIRQEGEDWISESPFGTVIVRFSRRNEWGILDHVAAVAGGEAFLNPMRVAPNGDGSELIFTLYRLPAMSEQAFREDAETVQKDLNKLKAILEGSGAGA